MTIPLGETEALRLEFKGSEVLQDLPTIGRAVVAMLNAQGGEIWIGVEERGGRATRVVPIPHPEQAFRAVQDHLVDAIDPAPDGKEVQVSIEPAGGGASVLCIRVGGSPKRKPYALLRSGGRHFVIRVGDRVRPMSREEIFSAPRAQRSEDRDIARAKRRLRAEKAELQSQGASILWIRVLPVVGIGLADLDRFVPLLMDPRRTGNRPSGWKFSDPHRTPESKHGRLVQGAGTSRHTEIESDGGITFRTPLASLHWIGPEREVWPFSLLELPVSVLRLAATVYKEVSADRDRKVLCDIALFRTEGWVLRPGSPLSPAYQFLSEPRPSREKDILLSDPLVLSLEEVLDAPDRCAFRLVTLVYDAFGYPEAAVPSEFDRKAGRLVIPD